MSFVSFALLSALAVQASARSLRVFDQSVNAPDASAWARFIPEFQHGQGVVYTYRRNYTIGNVANDDDDSSAIRIPAEEPTNDVATAHTTIDLAPAATSRRTVLLDFTFSFGVDDAPHSIHGYHFNVVIGDNNDRSSGGIPQGLGVEIKGGATKTGTKYDDYTYVQPWAFVYALEDFDFCPLEPEEGCTTITPSSSAAEPNTLVGGVVYKATLAYTADPLDNTLRLTNLHIRDDKSGATVLVADSNELSGASSVSAASWLDGTSQPSLYFMIEDNYMLLGNITVDFIDVDESTTDVQTTRTSTTSTVGTTSSVSTSVADSTTSVPETTETKAPETGGSSSISSSISSSSSSSSTEPSILSLNTLEQQHADQTADAQPAVDATTENRVQDLPIGIIVASVGAAAACGGLVLCVYILVRSRRADDEERSSERSLSPDTVEEFYGATPQPKYVPGKGLVRNNSAAASTENYTVLPSPASLEEANSIYGAGPKLSDRPEPLYDNCMPKNPSTGYVDIDLSDVSTSGEEMSEDVTHYDAPGSAFV